MNIYFKSLHIAFFVMDQNLKDSFCHAMKSNKKCSLKE